MTFFEKLFIRFGPFGLILVNQTQGLLAPRGVVLLFERWYCSVCEHEHAHECALMVDLDVLRGIAGR